MNLPKNYTSLRIVEAKLKRGYEIAIAFSNGQSGVVNLDEYKNIGGVFSSFRDPSFFTSFRIEGGTLAWGEDVDIAPTKIYDLFCLQNNLPTVKDDSRDHPPFDKSQLVLRA